MNFGLAVAVAAAITVALGVLAQMIRRRRPRSILVPLLIAVAGLSLLFEIAFAVAHLVHKASS